MCRVSICLSVGPCVPLLPVLWSRLRVCPVPFDPSPHDAGQSGAASCCDGHSSLPVEVCREEEVCEGEQSQQGTVHGTVS